MLFFEILMILEGFIFILIVVKNTKYIQQIA